MNEKISIFGATGFIGSEFVKKFPDDVISIPKTSIIPQSRKILYLISTVDNYNVLEDSKIDIETNLIHLMNVLDNCKNNQTEITFISSWFVYGEDGTEEAFETSPCNPKGFYSITKYSAEMLLRSFCETFDVKYKIIRLANVIGRGDTKVSKKKNALQYLIEEMRKGNDIALYSNGKFFRDYIHVDDVIDGISFIMNNGTHNEIYNLGGGEAILFGNIINYVHDKLNSKSKIGYMEPTKFHKIVGIGSKYLNTTKLKNLGFTPSYDILYSLDLLL